MISLDYSLEPAELLKLEKVDLTSATITDLDFYLFCGNVIFRIDEAVLDASWGWVPILNFASQLYEILYTIQDGETKSLEFTESEATIDFHRKGENITVTAEYASSEAITTVVELRKAVSIFCCRVIADLSNQWHELSQNPAFKQRATMICADHPL